MKKTMNIFIDPNGDNKVNILVIVVIEMRNPNLVPRQVIVVAVLRVQATMTAITKRKLDKENKLIITIKLTTTTIITTTKNVLDPLDDLNEAVGVGNRIITIIIGIIHHPSIDVAVAAEVPRWMIIITVVEDDIGIAVKVLPTTHDNHNHVDIGKGDTDPVVPNPSNDAVGESLLPKRNENERGKSTIIIITTTTKAILRMMIFQKIIIEEEKTCESSDSLKL
jgi:hypothetical protein